MAKRKLKLSAAERERRRKQARKNFGLTRSTKPRKSTVKIVRRKSRSYTMPRKKRKATRRKGMFGGKQRTKELIGAIGYAAIGEPLLDQVATKMGVGVSDDIIKGLAGWIIASNTTGVIKAVGDSAVVIAAYKFGLNNIKGKIPFLGNNTSNSTQTEPQNSVVIIG